MFDHGALQIGAARHVGVHHVGIDSPIGRLDSFPTMRWAVRAGVAAALVQTIGLLRWPLLVPTLTDADTFERQHALLGTLLGETAGYTLTAIWTALVIAARAPHGGSPRSATPAPPPSRPVSSSPSASSSPPSSTSLGYVLWSVWLLAFAALLARGAFARQVAVIPTSSTRSPQTN